MGTFRRPRISEREVVERFQAGEPRTLLCLRARMPDQWVRDVLAMHGVPLRSRAEAAAILKLKRQRSIRLGTAAG